VTNEWYLADGLFNPFTGEMWENFTKDYTGENITADKIWFCMLNDCIVSGLAIARRDGKYGIFPLKERTGTQSGEWSGMGETPFIYDDALVFADWNLWDDYGYVAVKKDGKWALLKITQFPTPKREILSDHLYESPEDAFRELNIDMHGLVGNDCHMNEVGKWYSDEGEESYDPDGRSYEIIDSYFPDFNITMGKNYFISDGERIYTDDDELQEHS
jgi:hypothetical protein